MSLFSIDQTEKKRIIELYRENSINLQNEQSFKDGTAPEPKGYAMDAHTALAVASIASLFIPVVGPFISLGFDLIDVGLYYKEGDYQGMALAAAFSILPLGDIYKMSKSAQSYTRKELNEIFQKGLLGRPMSRTEQKIIEDIATNKALFKRSLKRAALKRAYQRSLKELTFRQKLWMLNQIYSTRRIVGLTKAVIQVGGVYYTLQELFRIFELTPPLKGDPEKAKQIESIANYDTTSTDNQLTNIVDQQLGPIAERDDKFNEEFAKIQEKAKNTKK